MNSLQRTSLFCIGLAAFALVAPLVASGQEVKGGAKVLRTWKSKNGSDLIEAAFLKKHGDVVLLERKDGKAYTFRLDTLSDEDSSYVSELLWKSALEQYAAPPTTRSSSPDKQPAAETSPDRSTVANAAGEAFDPNAMIKAWSQPRKPFQLTYRAVVRHERNPDVIEYSANGEFLYVVFFKEAKHLIYDAKDGKLLHTIEYGTAPLTAAAITPNGKHLVASLGDEGTGVYDVAAKKEVFIHPRMKGVNQLRTTTGKETFILGSRASGEVYRYRLLDKFGLAFSRPLEIPANTDPNRCTELISGSDGNFLVVHWPWEPTIFFTFEFEEDGRLKENMVVEVSEGVRSLTGIGKRIFNFQAGDKTQCNHYSNMKFSRFIRQDFTGTVTPQFFMATDDSHSITYEPDRERLSVNQIHTGYGRSLQIRLGAKTEFIRLHWDSGQVATCDAAGRIVLLSMSGYRHRSEMILADLRACLDSKQDGRLEKLTAALEKDHTFFEEVGPRDTKYRIVTTILRNEGYLLYPNDGINPAWRGWQARNPHSRLTRYMRLYKLVEDAWEARGEGVASLVPEEAQRLFDQKMAQAEPIIESFAQEETIPPGVYPLIFLVAKGQQWDEAKTNVYVERMLKECPENISGHIEFAYSLQPRWGGKIDGPRLYAERIRKEFPGAIGDGTYSAIALALYFCNYYKVFGVLGFDSGVAQAGVKQLYRNNLDTPHHRQAELLVAVIARNAPEQRFWVDEVVRNRNAWIKGVMRELTFDEIMAQLAPR